MTNSTLESFEYFCQMSSKLILIMLSYTVSKVVHFLRHSVRLSWIENKALQIPELMTQFVSPCKYHYIYHMYHNRRKATKHCIESVHAIRVASMEAVPTEGKKQSTHKLKTICEIGCAS